MQQELQDALLNASLQSEEVAQLRARLGLVDEEITRCRLAEECERSEREREWGRGGETQAR